MPDLQTDPRILVVDDEPKLARLLREVLTATGFKVLVTGSGESAVEMAALEQPDLVLLDIVLAGALDGYAAARRIRAFSDVPIIMLTAKARESDLLQGFEAGADDYLTKPFSAKELLARVRAVLKRAHREPEAPVDHTLVCGAVSIDPVRRSVTLGAEVIRLTPTEYNLLYHLASHPNQVLLHEQLLTAVWGQEYRDDLDYLRAYIRHLRQKLEADPADPKLIVTSSGVGYMLVCPEEKPSA